MEYCDHDDDVFLTFSWRTFSYGNQSIELFLGKGVLIMQPMQLKPLNCLSVFDHFVGLALKE